MGRVAVIGGSEDYTGAPYFSAIASARLGCDMVTSLSLLALPSTDLFLRAM
jgi:ATP-dependent NAD(P)H-hydrate dehydratase